MYRVLALLGVLALQTGCMHIRPPEVADCQIDAYPLLVGEHHPRDVSDSDAVAHTENLGIERFEQGKPQIPSPFQVKLTSALTASKKDGTANVSENAALVLSGGGQHGPFGTGFFLGLPKVRNYRVVTGVSTGSLQSTFLFLARQQLPSSNDRVYPADLGTLDIRPGQSDIGDLALASSVGNERSLLRVNRLGVIGGLISGSVSSLDPLEQRVYGIISRDTLRAVSAEHAKGRSLFVGVSDQDADVGFALDLTALADHGVESGSEAGLDAARHCYARALLASSSVPFAAQPVSLAIHDVKGNVSQVVMHHLMIDGGARFGVFFRQLTNGVNAAPAKTPVDIDLIVNGSMYSTPWLNSKGQPIDRWSALTLALRTVDTMENQVYRFSVEQVESSTFGGRLRMAFISNENLPAGSVAPDDYSSGGKTCGEWSKLDEQEHHVLQFHPRYMACLLSYGRDRGSHDQWNLDSARMKTAL